MQYVNRKSLVVSLVLSLAACGGSEIQAEPAPDLTIESIEAGDVCATGGIIVYVDGVESATVCNGTDGVDGNDGEPGTDGDAPEVVVETIEPGDVCEAGGQEVRVEDTDGTVLNTAVVCNGVDGEAVAPQVVIGEAQNCDFGGVSVTIGDADPFEVCDGADGEAGEPGEAPSVSVGSPADCEFGGVSVTIGDAAPFDVCNGAPGADGEPGASPAIDVTNIDAGGVCGEAGGYLITITDAQGVEETATVCNGEGGGTTDPDPDPVTVITECMIVTDAVTTPEGTAADADGLVSVEVDGVGTDVPATFVAELGYGDVGTDPGTWTYAEGIADATGELLGEFGSSIVAGEYGFVWRVALEAGDAWTYCGVNGTFDTFTEADAGSLSVTTAAVPQTIVGWDFATDLNASEGTGSGEFFLNGVPTTCLAESGNQWRCDNLPESTDFFDADGVTPLADTYYRFESSFTAFQSISVEFQYRATGTGPTLMQIAAEFADGSLEFLSEPFVVNNDGSYPTETLALPPAAGEAGPVAYRFYPYGASGSGGNIRFTNVTFTGTAL
ncbi:hypothetical protein FRC98_05910 [Lujinxingia vulgaris]|uniref:Uncharacterized protein n=1 Tax=Lujinxingia vulgaris TaxID=2600176 RepID=A0A5C6X951_9DELT|nr:hypothetical protein [Lujinxingia vulgaris]TXD38422.1 hypothetical protein FRC98_05910 [Lujinxingia vulgaris]